MSDHEQHDRSVLLPAVAYPPHMLWVPLPLWQVITLGALVPGLIVGQITGRGISIEAVLIIGLALWAFCGWHYRRDPHVHRVWYAVVFGRQPFPPLHPTRNLLTPGRRRGQHFSS